MKLYRIIRRPPFFLRSSYWMPKRENPVKSSPNARLPIIIPTLLIQYGSLKAKLIGFRTVVKSLWISLKEMYKSASQLKKSPEEGQKLIDAATLQELESYAKKLGISKIGYTKVNPDFIYRDFDILTDKVMILAMEMDRDAIKTNPSEKATKEIWRTYSVLGETVNKIAEFLRNKGYKCHPSPAIGGDIMTVPVAQDAGIGVVGKNGILIAPEFGPSMRLAAIFLDVDNLPIKTIEDNEHLWVRDFCETCNHCVKNCPGKAIYEETKIMKDGYPKFIDAEKCAPFFSKNCSKCISNCPFIMGNYYKIKETYFTR
ncbi:MAG: hypothetical protein ACFB0B_03990 [Thermonemataceae bacterium]